MYRALSTMGLDVPLRAAAPLPMDSCPCQALPGPIDRGPCANGPTSRAERAFLYDAFVRLARTLDLILEFGVSFGQLLGHLIGAARGIPVEGGGLQEHGLPELEFVGALGLIHHRFNPSASADRTASL